MSEDQIEKPKPWMLHDISPEAREIAKNTSRKYNIKVGEWVNYIIIKSEESVNGDQEQVDIKTFSEIMEDVPTKGLMINIYNRLNSSIEELSKKISKPWWKFWG